MWYLRNNQDLLCNLSQGLFEGWFCFANWLAVGFIKFEFFDTGDLGLAFAVSWALWLQDFSPAKIDGHKATQRTKLWKWGEGMQALFGWA